VSYLEVAITTSAQQLADLALEKLQEELAARGIVGWEPNDSDLEIIEISAVSLMASYVANVAAVVPSAIFRKYGTELLKVAYNEGANATCSTQWTLLEENGEYPARIIEAGTQLTIGELAFYVESEVKVAKGKSSATVQLVAAERGTEYNGLKETIQLVDAINWVSEVKIVGESSGGVDQETDEEYQERLASLLALQAPRPITAENFAAFVLDAPSSILPTGVVVGRATAIDGYNPEAHTFEATPKTGSKVLKEVTSFTGVSPESTTLPQVHPGSRLKGTGIPEGTTVVKISESGKEIEMSAVATSEPGKEKIEAIGSYENQRTVTVFVTNKEGLTLTTEARAALKEYVEKYVELNFRVFVEPASYDKVYVTTKIHVLSTYSAASVAASVKAAITSYLSAVKWGNPEAVTTGANSWLNATQGYNYVRYNALIGLIESTPGVAYVFSGSEGLKTGSAATPAGTSDLLLTGPAPLPETESSYVVVTTG